MCAQWICGHHEYIGDILSSSGDVQYIAGIHDIPHINHTSPSDVLNIPWCTQNIPPPPDVLMIIPWCTERLRMYWTSSDVLNTHLLGFAYVSNCLWHNEYCWHLNPCREQYVNPQSSINPHQSSVPPCILQEKPEQSKFGNLLIPLSHYHDWKKSISVILMLLKNFKNYWMEFQNHFVHAFDFLQLRSQWTIAQKMVD